MRCSDGGSNPRYRVSRSLLIMSSKARGSLICMEKEEAATVAAEAKFAIDPVWIILAFNRFSCVMLPRR
jgi:hypothetical protein